MGLSNSLHGEKGWVLDKEWECQEYLGKNAYLALHLYLKKIEEKSTNYDFWDKSQRSRQL